MKTEPRPAFSRRRFLSGSLATGDFTNDTLERSVDGVLTCILGYEAAARRTRLTMASVLRENKRLEVDLRGLKT